jgi:hypothetical protein
LKHFSLVPVFSLAYKTFLPPVVTFSCLSHFEIWEQKWRSPFPPTAPAPFGLQGAPPSLAEIQKQKTDEGLY